MLDRKRLDNFGSLITIKGSNTCLGDLWHAGEQGTFDPSHGRVPVTKDEAQQHNAALDLARLQGMDTTCELGQGAVFYFTGGKVTTFSGTVVSAHPRCYGKVGIEFTRAGRVFRGRRSKSGENVYFKRVS